MTGRDANRGACAQPCRYQYALMEEKRPGEYFPVYEDERGTYILNSRDMCMIDHVPDLLAAGAGLSENRGPGQERPTTPPSSPAPTATPSTLPWPGSAPGPRVAGRGGQGRATGTTPPASSTASRGSLPRTPGTSGTGRWLAVVQSCTPQGLATASLRNKFAQGDPIELVGPGLRPVAFQAPLMADAEGEALPEPRHPQMTFQIQLPCYAPPLSFLRACRENS